ncbi:MAG: ornithine carbamoyltransferase [Acidobacteriota bacterium]
MPARTMPTNDPSLRIWSGQCRRDQDLTTGELGRLLSLAAEVKRSPKRYQTALAGRYVTLLFEKPSLRTRFTFELAVKQLGGDCVVSIGPIAEREPVMDVARNLARWTQAIVARVFLQQTVDDLAQFSGLPVVNALSDLYHPCQAFADLQTLVEKFGDVTGRKLVFVGDGNNVAHSLLLDCARLGIHMTVATPEGYEPNAGILTEAQIEGEKTGARIAHTYDAQEAVEGADAIYTDVWASMGQEKEATERQRVFAPYQVNEALMARARPNALFLHCLPAKRGQETTHEVMESAGSVVFDQAENRLHAQKALLLMLMGG